METPFTETFVELIDSPSAPLAAMFFDDNPLCYISSVISAPSVPTLSVPPLWYFFSPPHLVVI